MKISLDAEKNRYEIEAETWWKKNGFTVNVKKRFLTKSIYEISKDGCKSDYEIPFCITDMKGFMKGFETYWGLVVGMNG